MSAPLPAARGARLEWSALPERIRAAIEDELGGAVVAAVTQPEGFSPAVAARVRTADDVRAFVKAVPPDRNPQTPNIYRREIRVVTSLPAGLPAPRLMWWLDEGEDGWVALMFEEIAAAHPAVPWRRDQLAHAMDALACIARTPPPAWLADETSAGEWIAAAWAGWSKLVAQPPGGLDAWSRRHAERLAVMERDVAEATAGEALLHLDFRWDNLLVDTRRAWVVDWPWARRGAAWLDAVLFAPTVEMQGGPSSEELLAAHLREAGGGDAEAILVAVAATAGMLTERSLAPAPPNLPTIRAFQAATAAAFRAWLQRLTGWD